MDALQSIQDFSIYISFDFIQKEKRGPDSCWKSFWHYWLHGFYPDLAAKNPAAKAFGDRIKSLVWQCGRHSSFGTQRGSHRSLALTPPCLWRIFDTVSFPQGPHLSVVLVFFSLNKAKCVSLRSFLVSLSSTGNCPLRKILALNTCYW